MKSSVRPNASSNVHTNTVHREGNKSFVQVTFSHKYHQMNQKRKKLFGIYEKRLYGGVLDYKRCVRGEEMLESFK